MVERAKPLRIFSSVYPLSNFYVTKEAAIGISFKRVRKTTSERKKGSANSKDQMKEMMLMLMLMLMMMVVVEKKLTKFDWPWLLSFSFPKHRLFLHSSSPPASVPSLRTRYLCISVRRRFKREFAFRSLVVGHCKTGRIVELRCWPPPPPSKRRHSRGWNKTSGNSRRVAWRLLATIFGQKGFVLSTNVELRPQISADAYLFFMPMYAPLL
ncbi:uncharacterized protein LOC120296209 [Eucalyptus grandis]|uniref:uncharacterized protein LOC120296209 n=1 Tax=Eucalyptus grandis TaxID=71139 RepID=UPI00192E845E|nr:uncharacterized protein LOC120296209 [Eucalyptus grandis]